MVVELETVFLCLFLAFIYFQRCQVHLKNCRDVKLAHSVISEMKPFNGHGLCGIMLEILDLLIFLQICDELPCEADGSTHACNCSFP